MSRRRRVRPMRALWSLMVFVLLLGLASLAFMSVLVLLVGAAVFLALVVGLGTWHTNRVYARPVPCRICRGKGLHDDLSVDLCLTCDGTGNFAPSLREAIARDAA